MFSDMGIHVIHITQFLIIPIKCIPKRSASENEVGNCNFQGEINDTDISDIPVGGGLKMGGFSRGGL